MKPKLKSGQTYCLRWYDGTGRMRTETAGPDRKLAERLRSKRESDLNAGKLRETRRISFDEFREEELDAMRGRLAERSIEDLENTLVSFGDMFEVKALSDVAPGMVEDYVSWRLQDVAVATANKNLRTLKASFNRAVRRGYLETNPAADVKQVREPDRDLRVLTAEEVRSLLCACWSVRWKALVSLAVTTGMRLGEMLALRWEDVDFETGTVRVLNRPGQFTKSKRNRALALLPSVCELLGKLGINGPFVFHTRNGRPWHNNVKQQFRRLVERSGIKYCSIHDLRRTFVSHLAMAGINEALVKELAGHASIGTTLRYYTQILPEALRLAQASLPFESVLRDVSDSYHGPAGRDAKKTATATTKAAAAS